MTPHLGGGHPPRWFLSLLQVESRRANETGHDRLKRRYRAGMSMVLRNIDIAAPEVGDQDTEAAKMKGMKEASTCL